MRQVRQSVGLPVMADESLCTFEDGQRLIDSEAADIFNIRLGKCGGFSGAMRLVQLARENKLGCHLGSLVGETGILTSAAEDFGRRVEEFECLEGKGQNKVLLEADIVELVHRNPESNEAHSGLGIQVLEERLKRFSVSDSVHFKDEGIRA
jgi:muconate cycloisomerase